MEYNNNKQYDANVYVNFSFFHNSMFEKGLKEILNGGLNIGIIINLTKSIKIRKDKQNRVSDRKSLIPFSKWYVKMYHKIYQDKKILNAILNDTVNKLDKNLKVMAKKIINRAKMEAS